MELLRSIVDKIKARVKRIAIIALIVVIGLVSFKACRILQKKQDSDANSTILKPEERGKIIVDPVKHKITTVSRNPDGTIKTKETYLPDRPSVITEDKNGKVRVVTQKFGTEMRPYLGVGGALDGTPRVHAGADLWYFRKLDLGAGLDFNAGVMRSIADFRDTRLSVNASYNVWSNTSLALSFDNRRVVGLFVKVRL